MNLWKKKTYTLPRPLPLFAEEDQLMICKVCGPLPFERFADDGKYKSLCIDCETQKRSTKDKNYNRSERRKEMDVLRKARQPWERVVNNISGVYHLVAYDRVEFRSHMESLFKPWMSWENNGQGVGFWQIEHKIPRSFFGPYVDIENLSRCKQFQKLWCLENLRPFDAEENAAKSGKVILPEGVSRNEDLIKCSLTKFKELVKNWEPREI